MNGELFTESFGFDGGRAVTVYVPPTTPTAIVYAGDGQLVAPWGSTLERDDLPPTMIVGVHRLDDETLRLHEYSPGFDPERFAAHERFVVDDVRAWVDEQFGVAPPVARTAVCGVSASGELALALGLRHPDVFGAIFCASPGGGYHPPAEIPEAMPRTYLTGGTEEPWFYENAARWATALEAAGKDVVLTERPGNHGDPFWRDELAHQVAWAFGSAGS
jgi:enterochelin esterase-like enzyme